MRTSEEIYHRVRWDPRFDAARFVLGINARDAPPKRVTLAAFVPGGDIPWHRVLFVEADGERIWDRATGVDRIDETSAGRVRAPRRLRPPFFTARTPHAFGAGSGWGPVAEVVAGDAAAASLRVLTWNTLWDKYDADRIDTARRWPLLLAALEAADADVIALQEVERPLLELLLAAPWVRASYAVGTDPRGHDVGDSGLLLLSRLPVHEAAYHVLGPFKAITAITVECATGPVVVAAAHLTSDHAHNGAGRRDVELGRLAEGLSGVDGRLVLVGDLNDGGDTAAGVLGLCDAWTEVRGADDRTVTFDPTVNPLAAVSSLTGRASRLDRVLLRRGDLRPVDARLIGDVPVDGLFPSDHFGVVVDLTVEAAPVGAVDLPPTARTALAWVPSIDLWPAIQEVRLEHDPQIDRWPSHVNLLFGFVPESAFDEAAAQVALALTEVAPFEVRLEGVRSFAHRDDATIWLNPAAADPAPWIALRAGLERRFPRCVGRAEGYTPHLTLGRTRDAGRAGAGAAGRLGAMSGSVGELVLLSRRGDEAMRPRALVSLGSGEVRWLADDVSTEDDPWGGRWAAWADGPCLAEPRSVVGAGAAAASVGGGLDRGLGGSAEVVERLVGALPEGEIYVVGSRRLGCALPGADLDLVVALPGDVDLDELRVRVRAALPKATGIRPVVGARVPGLRLAVGALDVDLVAVGTGTLPVSEAVARRTELDGAAAVALSAVSDAQAILDAVDGSPAFPALAREVKAWARRRGLDSAPFGGLPGLAWTVLAARTVRDGGDRLADFLTMWAAWDWRETITLTGSAPGTEDPMTILTPTYPVRSCTTQVGPTLCDLVTQELYHSWEGHDPVPPHRRHAAWALLTVEQVPGEPFDQTVGRFRGRVRALLALLEDAADDVHAWPRPFDVGPSHRRYAIGLGHRPPDAARLTELAAVWLRGLPGVHLDRADNGAVPTLR